MQKIKVLKISILFSAFIPYISLAHSGHGITDVPVYLHQILYHALSSWSLLFLLTLAGLIVYTYKSFEKNKTTSSLNNNKNNDRSRGQS